MNARITILIFITLFKNPVFSQSLTYSSMAERNETISDKEGFILAPILNACGENFVWDLRADFIWENPEVSYNSSIDEKTLNSKTSITPEFIRKKHKDFPFLKSVEDTFSSTDTTSIDGYNFESGKYRATFCANGTMQLPEMQAEEVTKLKIEETLIFRNHKSWQQLEIVRTSNYFYSPKHQKPILCFKEQSSVTNSFKTNYNYALCRYLEPK